MAEPNSRNWLDKTMPWLWAGLSLIVAWIFVDAAEDKLVGEPAALKPFEEIGLPIWVGYLTAVGEIAGAIALIIPYTRSYGGLLLSAIMLGAALVNLLNGHPDYLPMNAGLLIGSLALSWQGRKHAWVPVLRRS